MKKAKTPTAKKTSAKASKKHPVPEWMDDSLKPTAEKLDILERHALAEELEKKAAQLRDFDQPKPDMAVYANVGLRPKMKEAVLYFADTYGSSDQSEAIRLGCGVRWILEASLRNIERLAEVTSNDCYYCTAEGLEQANYSEALVGQALDAWREKRNAGSKADED